MTPALAQRQVALACVAFLGAVVGLALASPRFRADDDRLPRPVATWYTARATVNAVDTPRRSACGQLIDGQTEGVAHAVLPCNAKLYVAVGDKEVLTHVVDKLPNVPGPPFDLTKPLADELGISGTARIRWTFAG